MAGRQRILIVGGGYLGMFCARRLEQLLEPEEHDVVLVNDENFMQYQPFLPEAASGTLQPRNVVVPLRSVLKRTRVVAGEVDRIDHDRRAATVDTIGGERREIAYDQVVVAPGSRSRVLPIPGLVEHAVGFKTVAEAIFLRNWVLSRLELADQAPDPARRRRALTFVFVGGGYAGVEALAELEEMACAAAARFGFVRREEMRWVLVEAMPTIMPEIGEDLAGYTLDVLRARGIDVRLETTLESVEDGVVRLSDGTELAADTLVWTAGVVPHPLASDSGFPVDETGRLLVDEYLHVRGVAGAWGGGDCAAVPDVTTGKVAPPTAQHALREARRLAGNLSRTVRGQALLPFVYRNRGQLVQLGHAQGVARVFGRRMHGRPAWWLHRGYHLLQMPTLTRKVQVLLDWTLAEIFPRDLAQLGSIQRPREPFARAAREAPETPRKTA